MSRISVIGRDGSPLSRAAAELVESAAIVVGGKRHLEEIAVGSDRAVVFERDLSAALSRIEAENGPVVVLASGDPGFFGITRLLEERFGSANLQILPAVSSVALAFARAGLSWDDAVTVSAHGREPRRAVNVCRAHPKVAVLTSPDFGPAELAGSLDGLGRTFLVAERLGGPDERVFRGEAGGVAGRSWEDPNVVLVLDEERVSGKGWISSGYGGVGRWALPEDEFEHRSGMITKSSTRALVLSRLGPGPGDLVWDVGAGSGSVIIECARLGAAAIGVERDPGSCARIRRNAERHSAYVEVVEGAAPDALRDLPEPDAVFVGGTGGPFEEIVKLCAVRARRSVVLTLVGIERVVPAGRVLEDCGLEVETTLLQTSPLKGIASMHRIVPDSAVFVVCGSRS
ncbi:MAG: Cobalt-precorrin-7 (C5)-methyltransferase / Cobalt-precorrin-6B C15-methyltransferase [decarboxylating] [uncultured Rubrobacteraceae bacterium]|uniref:Cobalt-precorrin-7 (C5)-methyltransferase / Cobalt-precorrin-6B C15-methyltransferase [decarboxylating] n=1 Tax=uncultured Rubrobacteraceae bacterium TaxID=349277 RepID=A0A6J4P1P4_9ACTN|nr:MAG: Cobalt-precorrin-7 (C5)-methyltransferase / Cobalt-precorrin-6B C15-methyltransferase [decarboxylating] [uncultured Rubrobacteraceae bacterium]